MKLKDWSIGRQANEMVVAGPHMTMLLASKGFYLSVNGSPGHDNSGECHKGDTRSLDLAFWQCIDTGKLIGDQTGVDRPSKCAC